VEDFIRWIFPDVRAHAHLCLTPSDTEQHDAWFRQRAILTSRNDVALQINNVILDQLDPSTEHLAVSLDSIADPESGDVSNFPVEFLNSLTPSGLPPHKLRLRAGAVVIVLRNLDKERGICNGCRCLVLKISQKLLDVRILTGRSAGKRYLLPRIPFRSGAAEFPFILRRRQFPVRLAWAMSIHKAQGQTLTQCGVLLPEPVFTHGQLYVCASRSSSARGLRFWLGDPLDGHGYLEDATTGNLVPNTHNIIFPAVLKMFLSEETQEAGSSSPLPSTMSPLDSNEVAKDVEYVELSETAQWELQRALHMASATAEEELGAVDLTLDADDYSPLPCSFLRRAELLGVTRSVWAEVSQRSLTDIEEFLRTEERPDTPGGSSSV